MNRRIFFAVSLIALVGLIVAGAHIGYAQGSRLVGTPQGGVQNGVYTNPQAGFSFTLPAAWVKHGYKRIDQVRQAFSVLGRAGVKPAPTASLGRQARRWAIPRRRTASTRAGSYLSRHAAISANTACACFPTNTSADDQHPSWRP